jgi:hypothetical protein
MAYFSTRALRWAAPVALVGALGLAACGNSDSEAIRTAAPSAAGVGSDQHLGNQAAELAQEELAARAGASVGSDQHLDNQAAEIASQRADRAASDRLTGQAEQMQRAQAARLAASAEWHERSAHLAGQAQTYATDVATNSDASLPNAWEAGNKAVEQQQYRESQKAQANAYLDSLESRAVNGSSGGGHEFLPGSRHLPVR